MQLQLHTEAGDMWGMRPFVPAEPEHDETKLRCKLLFKLGIGRGNEEPAVEPAAGSSKRAS